MSSVSPDDLIALRHQLALTQAQAAEAFGVLTNSWARWERGEMGIAPSYAFAIRTMLDRVAADTRQSSLETIREELLSGVHARARRSRKPHGDVAPPASREQVLQGAILDILATWRTLHASSLLTLIRSKHHARGEDIEAALRSLEQVGYLEVAQDPVSHRVRYSLSAKTPENR